MQNRKTKCMLLSRKQHRLQISVSIGEQEVEQVRSYKLLGLTVTEDLAWSTHISNACLRLKSLLGCMYQTFSLAPSKCLDHLYEAVVRPVLEYAAAVWNPPHTVHCKCLERVQSFVARVVSQSWDASSSSLVSKLGWPSLKMCRSLQQLICRRILRGHSVIPAIIFAGILGQQSAYSYRPQPPSCPHSPDIA